MRSGELWVLGAIALSVGGCSNGAARAESSDPTAVASSTTSAPERAEPERAVPEPVYPRTSAPPEPLAARLCDALHTLPAKRKAECCNGEPGTTLVDECVRTLSYALQSKAITLDPADVDRCAEASTKAYEGCGWVAPLTPRAPDACVGIVRGAMKEGERCRSSLECEDGLRCHGVAASDTGRCGKPKSVGACSRGIDTLASYTRQTDVERRHPECDGHCNGRRCEADVALGETCTNSLECGAGRRCVDKKCTSTPLPAAGEPCAKGACAGEARCIAGTCAAPKGNGEMCANDAECIGACDRSPGQSRGACAMLCSARIPGARVR